MLAIGHPRRATVEARTVREALKAMADKYPGLGDNLYDERGRLRPVARIAVGEEILAEDREMDRPVKQGESILVFQSIAGG